MTAKPRKKTQHEVLEEIRDSNEHILNALKKLTRMFELGVKISGGIIPMNEVANTLDRINGKYRVAEQEPQDQGQAQ